VRRKLSCPDAPPFILTTHQMVAFNRQSSYWLDVEAFEQQVTDRGPLADRLQSAINLYCGDLAASRRKTPRVSSRIFDGVATPFFKRCGGRTASKNFRSLTRNALSDRLLADRKGAHFASSLRA
jgi:hypothetical protein